MKFQSLSSLGSNHRKLMTLVLLIGGFLISFPITLLVVTIPSIADYFNSSVSIISWTITGPFLAFGVFGIAFGKAGDVWGHKRVFVGGLFLTGLFGLLSALSWSPLSLIVFRILSAACGSATGPSAMSFVNQMFEPSERIRPFGMWNFSCAIAPVFGIVFGAPLVEIVGWRVIFFVQGPLCMIAAGIAAKTLFETVKQSEVKFDLGGSFLLGAGSVLVLLAINRGSSWGWADPRISGLFITGSILITAFVFYEQRIDHPLAPLKWMSNSDIVLPIGTLGLLNFSYMGSFLIVAQLLSDGLGYSTQHVGWLVIARPFSYALLSPFGGKIAARIGNRSMGMLGASAIMLAAVPMGFVRGPGWDFLIVLGLGLTGVGLAIASPSHTAIMSFSAGNENIGIASALMQLSVHLGAVVGGAVMIAIQESTVGLGLMTSYGLALSSGAVVGASALLMASKIRQ